MAPAGNSRLFGPDDGEVRPPRLRRVDQPPVLGVPMLEQFQPIEDGHLRLDHGVVGPSPRPCGVLEGNQSRTASSPRISLARREGRSDQSVPAVMDFDRGRLDVPHETPAKPGRYSAPCGTRVRRRRRGRRPPGPPRPQRVARTYRLLEDPVAGALARCALNDSAADPLVPPIPPFRRSAAQSEATTIPGTAANPPQCRIPLPGPVQPL